MAQINNILLVDDDSMIRQLAEMSLSQLGGFTVKACDSGKSALLALQSFTPDIVLLDSNMPEMDGPETLSKIHSTTDFSNLPAVFITGETRPDEIDKLKALGAIDVIVKPFDPMTLSDQINAISDQL